jgi:hypothetical protein
MHDVPPDTLTFDDYGKDEELNQDTSGYNITKGGLIKKDHEAEYYHDNNDIDRDHPDAMRPHTGHHTQIVAI